METLPDRDLGSQSDALRGQPADAGTVQLIVRRPRRDERESVATGELDVEVGLVGDDWLARGSSSTPDRTAEPEAQVTLMSVRVLEAIEPDRDRWPLAGDQLYVDLDLSVDNLPVGTRLSVGDALVEVTALPHTGCRKFAARFGVDALAWISTPEGKRNRMRGCYVSVVRGGTVRVGDLVRKVQPAG